MGKSSKGELAATCSRSCVRRRQPGSPLRRALEERDQLVGRLERAAPQMRWNDRFHGVELLCRIATRVDLGGRRIIKKKKKGNISEGLRLPDDEQCAYGSERLSRDSNLVQALLQFSG